MEKSPTDSMMKIKDKNEIHDKDELHDDTSNLEESEPKKKTSSVLTVMVAGLALFSDGYNAQIGMSSAIPACFAMLTSL